MINNRLMPRSFLIDGLLVRFKKELGNDFDKYRNHVYRVFLSCLLLDKEEDNIEKYAIASVFHDIAIWTHGAIDYLEPSVQLARRYLHSIGKEQWVDEISAMIYWHHKLSTYKGAHSQTVSAFRKADWIDVSLGLLTFNISRSGIRRNRQQFPNRGFHRFLLKKIVRNFFRNPLHPLPMFRK